MRLGIEKVKAYRSLYSYCFLSVSTFLLSRNSHWKSKTMHVSVMYAKKDQKEL